MGGGQCRGASAVIRLSFYLSLLDCDSTEPAKLLVSALYLALLRTCAAVASIAVPVCLLGSDCESTEPASFFWIPDEFLLASVFAACELALLDDAFLFFAMVFCLCKFTLI